jgi:hypothetical protein
MADEEIHPFPTHAIIISHQQAPMEGGHQTSRAADSAQSQLARKTP